MNKITLAREFESCETIENLGGFLKKIITHENTDYPQSDILEIRADFYNQCSLLLNPEEAYWRTILNHEINCLVRLEKLDSIVRNMRLENILARDLLERLCFYCPDRFDVFEMYSLLYDLNNFHERSINKFKVADEYRDIQAYLLTEESLSTGELLTNIKSDEFNEYILNSHEITTVRALIQEISYFIDQHVNNFIDEQQ